jgi:hypothetical protein
VLPGLYFRYISVGFYLLYTFSGCKDSANRTKYQIYLDISEVQPIFNLQSKLKLVQTERNTKSQRAKVEKKFIFTLLSEAEIQ